MEENDAAKDRRLLYHTAGVMSNAVWISSHGGRCYADGGGAAPESQENQLRIRRKSPSLPKVSFWPPA